MKRRRTKSGSGSRRWFGSLDLNGGPTRIIMMMMMKRKNKKKPAGFRYLKTGNLVPPEGNPAREQFNFNRMAKKKRASNAS